MHLQRYNFLFLVMIITFLKQSFTNNYNSPIPRDWNAIGSKCHNWNINGFGFAISEY